MVKNNNKYWIIRKLHNITLLHCYRRQCLQTLLSKNSPPQACVFIVGEVINQSVSKHWRGQNAVPVKILSSWSTTRPVTPFTPVPWHTRDENWTDRNIIETIINSWLYLHKQHHIFCQKQWNNQNLGKSNVQQCIENQTIRTHGKKITGQCSFETCKSLAVTNNLTSV